MTELVVDVIVRAGARERSLTVKDGRIVIKTPIAPEKGRANRDVVDMLADHFNVAKSCVLLLKGEASSRKKFKIMA